MATAYCIQVSVTGTSIIGMCNVMAVCQMDISSKVSYNKLHFQVSVKLNVVFQGGVDLAGPFIRQSWPSAGKQA